MDNERAKELINILLYQILNYIYIEVSKDNIEKFIDWLRIEVGITNDELKELYFIEQVTGQN